MVDILHSALITGVVGGWYSRTPGGTTLFTRGGSGSDLPPPFSIQLTNDGTDHKITLTPGVVGGFLPSNFLTPITVHLESTCYVWLDVESDGTAVTGCTVNAGNTAFYGQTPTESAAPTSFQIPVGVILDGKPYNLLGKYWVNAVPVVAMTTYPAGVPTNQYIWNW